MASFHHRLKSGKKGYAADHAAYISREGKYAHHDPLLWSGYGNMPAWAENDTSLFWKTADKYERKNGSVYREHEIALPCELTLEQQRELVDELVERLAGTKAHQYAVHGPSSSLAEETNTHLHLMLSERIQDGHPRSPSQTFARFNPKAPEHGGCKKDGCGRDALTVRNELIATRKMIADAQNAALEKYGHATRVDHRSLKAQGIQRTPERHLGPAKIKRMSPEERSQYVAERRTMKA